MTDEVSWPYINTPTKALVVSIGKYIENNPDLAKNEAVKAAFSRFDAACKKQPAIVEYIQKHADPENPELGFNEQQLELLMWAMICRASSAYVAIPRASAEMANSFDFHAASKVGRNAAEENGNGGESHSEKLLNGMRVLGQALHCKNMPSPISYQMMRHIRKIRKELGENHFGHNSGDYEKFKKYVKDSSITPLAGYFYACSDGKDPRDTINDIDRKWLVELAIYKNTKNVLPEAFKVAVHAADIIPDKVYEYHDLDLTTPAESRLPAIVNAIKLASREASSADEIGSDDSPDNLSYIGAWGLLVNSYLGHVDDKLRKTATEWSRVHNDEALGQNAGWAANAELGHANDAGEVLTSHASGINTNDFVEALNTASMLAEARLELWDELISKMEGMKSKALITFSPAVYKEPEKIPSLLERAKNFIRSPAGVTLLWFTLTHGYSDPNRIAMHNVNNGTRVMVVPRGAYDLWKSDPLALFQNPQKFAEAVKQSGGNLVPKWMGEDPQLITYTVSYANSQNKETLSVYTIDLREAESNPKKYYRDVKTLQDFLSAQSPHDTPREISPEILESYFITEPSYPSPNTTYIEIQKNILTPSISIDKNS